ncbi:MAG TPA: heavy metal-associated domain-containing protein [Chitinophagaceae bacterium]|nr:heavy metal-associated domain-containing protein [Chitinophagaceae bacterium]
MTCSGCQTTVQDALSTIAGVTAIQIDLKNGEVLISMMHHIDIAIFQAVLGPYPKYSIQEKEIQADQADIPLPSLQKSWIQTYKPLLLVFAFITSIACLTSFANNHFIGQLWMNHFMAGFFIVFSFFKFLDIRAFADSYAMYDVIAKQWKGYGYLYPFIELLLGIAYLTAFNLILTNSITVVVMSISSIGVMQSVVRKQKIRCACLGAVFNLPMSTVTIIEDVLMVIMAASMLFI